MAPSRKNAVGREERKQRGKLLLAKAIGGGDCLLEGRSTKVLGAGEKGTERKKNSGGNQRTTSSRRKFSRGYWLHFFKAKPEGGGGYKRTGRECGRSNRGGSVQQRLPTSLCQAMEQTTGGELEGLFATRKALVEGSILPP